MSIAAGGRGFEAGSDCSAAMGPRGTRQITSTRTDAAVNRRDLEDWFHGVVWDIKRPCRDQGGRTVH